MKTVLKNVYYCDHCKKRGLSKSHMSKHETGCTANINRVCGKCDGIDLPKIVSELKLRFDIDKGLSDISEWECLWSGEPVTLDEVRKLADGCPNCMLAILRQTHLNYQCCKLAPFDYKQEFKEFGIKKTVSPEEYAKYYGMDY